MWSAGIQKKTHCSPCITARLAQKGLRVSCSGLLKPFIPGRLLSALQIDVAGRSLKTSSFDFPTADSQYGGSRLASTEGPSGLSTPEHGVWAFQKNVRIGE